MRKLVFLSFLILSSCGIFDGTNVDPSYIYFSEPELIVQADQGANTHNIQDYWIEMDGTNLGISPIPGTVAFLPTTEEPLVLINAGIRPNGVLGSATSYPMYEFLQPVIDFVPEQEDTLKLSFRYKQDVKFSLIEGFEASQLFTRDEDDDPGSFVEIQSNDVRTGNSAAKLTVTEAHPILEVSNLLGLNDVPDNGTAVYLEFDYKNDVSFVVGLIGSTNGTETRFEKVVIPERDNWNKIYINFTQDIEQSGFDSYHVIFIVHRDDNSPDAENSVLLDNVKFVHF